MAQVPIHLARMVGSPKKQDRPASARYPALDEALRETAARAAKPDRTPPVPSTVTRPTAGRRRPGLLRLVWWRRPA